jgi:hypothetical protein
MGLDRLDPVCLTDFDPATTRHTVLYEPHDRLLCPVLQKQFLADPAAYLSI